MLAMAQVLVERSTYFTSLRDYPLVTGNYRPVFIGVVGLFEGSSVPRSSSPAPLRPRHPRSRGRALRPPPPPHRRRRPLRRPRPPLPRALVRADLGALGRVDMPALFFSAAGLLVFVRTGGKGGKRRYLAFPLFWLAFFTRRTPSSPAAVSCTCCSVPIGKKPSARVSSSPFPPSSLRAPRLRHLRGSVAAPRPLHGRRGVRVAADGRELREFLLIASPSSASWWPASSF